MKRGTQMLGLRARRSNTHRRGGFALIIVLLVLLALLVLCAPFLAMARNADRASSQIADRAEARIALDGAARHARVVLADTQASLDKTPYFDSLEEIAVDNHFEPGFFDANDSKGLMWDLEVHDIAGKIDLDSAPPQVIANLFDGSARFSKAIAHDDKELPLSSAAHLEASGFVWSDGELIHYGKIDGSALVDFARGVLGPPSETEWTGGPRPAAEHDAGAPVIDQRAFAPALWRMGGGDGELRRFDSMEQLRGAGRYALSSATEGKSSEPQLDEEILRPLFHYGSVHAGVRAGPVWQHAARVKTSIKGGHDGKLSVDNTRWLNPGPRSASPTARTTELALVTASWARAQR